MLTFKNHSQGVGAWSMAHLSSFYVSHKSEFVSHAERLLRDRALAEEIVQEAFLKVILAAPELDSNEHAKSYMHKAIRNLCLDTFRLEGRRPKLVSLEDSRCEVEAIQPSTGNDYSDIVAAADDAAVVRQAIALLSKAERAALVMWEIEGRSVRDIALELGIKPSVVRHTISRARSSLRRILSEIVIDETRGLTGLDLLSRTYQKAEAAAKKHSKSAMALLIFLLSIATLSQLSLEDSNRNSLSMRYPVQDFASQTPDFESISLEDREVTGAKRTNQNKVKKTKTQETKINFPGLDGQGRPIGFTVGDSTGAVGQAYFRDRTVSGVNSYFGQGHIIKTEEGAANVFIVQELQHGRKGTQYNPMISFGRGGQWVPLLVEVVKIETTRLEGGIFMLTVEIAVESVVETTVKIASSAKGRDLEEAPSRVITRIIFEEKKNAVLAQAVYVEERVVGA